jgi:hypothetical protein
MLPADAPPGVAAAGGATRIGLPSIRDLGSCAAAPRKPWSSAPPIAADIAGAREKVVGGGAAAAGSSCDCESASEDIFVRVRSQRRGVVSRRRQVRCFYWGRRAPIGVCEWRSLAWTWSMGNARYRIGGAGASVIRRNHGVGTRCGMGWRRHERQW